MPPMFTENISMIEDDDVAYISDHKKIKCSICKDSVVESSRKQLKKIKKNQYATLQLSKHNELNESIKNKSSYICTDPPGCSVQEVLYLINLSLQLQEQLNTTITIFLLKSYVEILLIQDRSLLWRYLKKMIDDVKRCFECKNMLLFFVYINYVID